MKTITFKVYTLIELLITIAIIMLLITILLPSLQKVKRLSKQITCKNNLRQIFIGDSNYVEEFDGFMMPSSVWTPGQWGGRRHWCRIENWPSTTPAPFTVPFYMGLKGSFESMQCPANKFDIYSADFPAKYSPNYWIARADANRPGTSNYPVKINKVKLTSLVIRYIDAPRYDATRSSFYAVQNIGNYSSQNSDNRWDKWYWHNNFNNIVLCDGHVDSVKHPAPTYPWSAYWYSSGYVAGKGYGFEYDW